MIGAILMIRLEDLSKDNNYVEWSAEILWREAR